jgi:nucleoside-diphosphate-sugar epimerase
METTLTSYVINKLKNMKKNKILVTGATGFVGSNLVRRLVEDNNNEIYITLRESSNIWRIKDIFSDLKSVYCDISIDKQVKETINKIKPDIVYHCATYGGFPIEKDFDKIIQTNIISTINLINNCDYKELKAFINLSSSSEYGIKNKPMLEDSELNPSNSYGLSKVVSTSYASKYGKINNMPIITFRLFSPFGYYESRSRLFPTLFLSVINNQSPRLASPESSRDFIFIKDVVDLLIHSTRFAKKYAGEIFNIGTGNQYSVKEIADMIIKSSGKNIEPNYASVNKREYDNNYWIADMKKTFESFNWEPKYSIKESINLMLKWFEDNKGDYEDGS